MGYADRDYAARDYRGPGREGGGVGVLVGHMRMWSFNTWIIAINVLVFLADGLLVNVFRVGYIEQTPIGPVATGPIEFWGRFTATDAVLGGQIWRFISFQFLHANLPHIAMNMLGLFFFGPLIERYLGSRRYLAFSLLCGVAGPISYMLLWATHLLVTHPSTPLIGASAGVFGVLMAAAIVAPHTTVYIYGILPVKLRHVAWLLIGVAVYTVVFFGKKGGFNAGGEAAHLGGAAVGYLLVRRPDLLNWANRLLGGSASRAGTTFAPKPKKTRARRGKPPQSEVDRILQKISDEGLASLSEEEKQTLADASRD